MAVVWPFAAGAAVPVEHWSPADGARAVPPNAVIREYAPTDADWEVAVIEDGALLALERVEIPVKVGRWVEWRPVGGFNPGATVDVWSDGARVSRFIVGPFPDTTPPAWDGAWRWDDGALRLDGIDDDGFSPAEIAWLATEIDGRIDLPYAGAGDRMAGGAPTSGARYQIVLVDGAGNATPSMPLDLSPAPVEPAGCATSGPLASALALLWGAILARRERVPLMSRRERSDRRR